MVENIQVASTKSKSMMSSENTRELLPTRQSEVTDREEGNLPTTSSREPTAESTPIQSKERRHVTISMDCTQADSSNIRTPTPSNVEGLQFEQLFIKMTDTIAAAIKCSSTPQKQMPLPEFRGMDHESVQTFIDRMEDYFRVQQITDYNMRLSIITNQLKGEARKWFEPYQFLINRYTIFIDRLQKKYDSTDSITQATTRLYGEKQALGESVSVFITRKMCLFQRVDATKPELIKTNIVLDQLRPELRSRLRGIQIRNMEELVDVASQIENDLKEITSSRGPPIMTERRNQEPLRTIQRTERSANQGGPPTPCRFCPGSQWHYHNDCPNNPYLQRNRPGTSSRYETSNGPRSNRTWRAETVPNTQNGINQNRGVIARTAENQLEENYPENCIRTEEPIGRQSSTMVRDSATDSSHTKSH